MAYAHAKSGEHCARCNDLAARVVGTQPLCVNHFAHVLDHCRISIVRRLLTPPNNPVDYSDWATHLRQGVDDGHITVDDAKAAWEHARTTAA